MRNREIVQNLNCIVEFVKKQEEVENALLSVAGSYALFKNQKKLLEVYEPYTKSLELIQAKYKDNEAELIKSVNELLDAEVDVTLDKITSDDFKEGLTISHMNLLNFMIE